MTSIGNTTFQRFPARSHNWATGMNNNMIKASALLPRSAKSRTTPLPASAADGDCYIVPETNVIAIWYSDQWWTITPSAGMWFYIEDANEFALMKSPQEGWITAIDLDDVPPPIERTLSFYAPGIMRRYTTLFNYVCAMEFTIPANAEGSFAKLDVPPVGGDVVFTMQTSKGAGQITFLEGETEGTFTLPNELVLHAVLNETLYARADTLTVRTGVNLFGAEGLSVSIRGKIRAMDE